MYFFCIFKIIILYVLHKWSLQSSNIETMDLCCFVALRAVSLILIIPLTFAILWHNNCQISSRECLKLFCHFSHIRRGGGYFWTQSVCYAVGLDQRSRDELWMLANHISSQLQGTCSRAPAVTIVTDDIDNPTVIALSTRSICNLSLYTFAALLVLQIFCIFIIVDWYCS